MAAFITDPVVSAERAHKYLGIFGMVWITILITSLFTAMKTFSLGDFVFPVTILTYPLVYIFGDIFTEVYGYRVSRKIVWTGFGCMLLASIFAFLYSAIPANAAFTYNDEFNLIFRATPLIAIAGIFSFSLGELTNSYIVAKVKIWTEGRHEWLRLVLSTLFGQTVDNTLWFTSAFLIAGWYTSDQLLPLVMSCVIFCTLWEVAALPLTYRAIALIKRKEGLDTYDHGTNFNPLSLK